MPRINLTMDQWGLLLKAIRHCKAHAEAYLMFSQADYDAFSIIEDQVLDMAFDSAKVEVKR